MTQAQTDRIAGAANRFRDRDTAMLNARYCQQMPKLADASDIRRYVTIARNENRRGVRDLHCAAR